MRESSANNIKKMNINNIQIREASANDFNEIMQVERQAFGYDKEALLTAGLLADPTAEPRVSLLAFEGDEPVGHILFTRAYFADRPESPTMHILAPLAVKPKYQRLGVGGLLIEAGIEKLRQMSSRLVFVLGYATYYPRRGFTPDAARLGYPAPYPIPEEFKDCWMVRAVDPDGFEIGRGAVECCEAMDRPEHWRDDEADKVRIRDKARTCVKDTVLPLQRGQFEACGRCLDEQYRRFGDTEFLKARVIEPGRVYEIGYPACVCPDVLSGRVTDPAHCECSRQSVLYILGELMPDKSIDVETIETVLGGAAKCRFKVIVE